MGLIANDELQQLEAQASHLSRSLGALIRYLDESDFKDRGRFRSRQRQGGTAKQTAKGRGTKDRTDQGPGTGD